ncbi:MAG: alpha/beta hydrolase [Tatlockia sp.]|jgi:pimeloyl-ACP methyl ester carboxylesterase
MVKKTHLALPGFKIAYRTWGNPDLPPLIAVHGWLDNANSFSLLAPMLQEQFHVIAIDLPGHGLSSHLPVGCNYHLIDGIFIVLQVIEALQLKKVHLLGHSLGACLASLIAGVSNEHIASLALIEGLGPFTHPEDTCCAQLTGYAQLLLDAKNSQARPYPSRKAAIQGRVKHGFLEAPLVALLAKRGVHKRGDSYYWRHDRRLATVSPLRMTENQVLSCLSNIAAKTCLILARESLLFREELVEQRVNAVKHISVHRLQGGHHLHMENPESLAQCLNAFYQEAGF